MNNSRITRRCIGQKTLGTFLVSLRSQQSRQVFFAHERNVMFSYD